MTPPPPETTPSSGPGAPDPDPAPGGDDRDGAEPQGAGLGLRAGRLDATADADAALDRFLADARVREAADARRRRWWRGRQLAEESSLAGVLETHAEAGGPVVVRTTTSTHRGRLRSVGSDHLAIDMTDAVVIVGLAAVVSVEGGPTGTHVGSGVVDVHGAADERPDLVSALAQWLLESPVVRVLGPGPDVGGRLEAVGVDIARLATGEDGRRWVHVALRPDLELRLERR
jgi:hypothetical protein